MGAFHDSVGKNFPARRHASKSKRESKKLRMSFLLSLLA